MLLYSWFDVDWEWLKVERLTFPRLSHWLPGSSPKIVKSGGGRWSWELGWRPTGLVKPDHKLLYQVVPILWSSPLRPASWRRRPDGVSVLREGPAIVHAMKSIGKANERPQKPYLSSHHLSKTRKKKRNFCWSQAAAETHRSTRIIFLAFFPYFSGLTFSNPLSSDSWSQWWPRFHSRSTRSHLWSHLRHPEPNLPAIPRSCPNLQSLSSMALGCLLPPLPPSLLRSLPRAPFLPRYIVPHSEIWSIWWSSQEH